MEFSLGQIIWLLLYLCFLIFIGFWLYRLSRYIIKKGINFIIKRAWFLAKLAAVTAFLAAVVLPLVYITQEKGVCLKEGRVLSPEELRRRVLLSLVKNRVEKTIFYGKKCDTDYVVTGIGSSAPETDIRKILKTALYNEKSVEENFGLEMLVLGRRNIPAQKFDFDSIVEPFLLVTFDKRDSDGGGLCVSSDVQEVGFSELETGEPAEKWKLTRYERLLGYGNHYFRIYCKPFRDECCDNRLKTDRRMTPDNYIMRKRRAYFETLSFLDYSAKIDLEQPHAVIISNCGDILQEKPEKDLGCSIYRITRTVPLIRGGK
jgi:hypothetical protein